MRAPFLMGLFGGQRALTPLAAAALGLASRRLPASGAFRVLAHPIAVAAVSVLAVGEMAADKRKTSPDRIAPVGLAARFVTSAIAGAAVAPTRRGWRGAIVGGATAVAAAYPGWRARMATLPRFGQTRTGLIEDAIVMAGTAAVLLLRRSRPATG